MSGAIQRQPSRRSCGTLGVGPLNVRLQPSARIDSGRSCLTSKGLHAVGGPAFPSRPPDPVQPDGELMIRSSTHPTFLAFYSDAARAERIEPALRRDDSGKHVWLERRGAVTIVWTQAPAAALRHTVWGCVA